MGSLCFTVLCLLFGVSLELALPTQARHIDSGVAQGSELPLAEPGQAEYYFLADQGTPPQVEPTAELQRTQRSFWKQLFKDTGLKDLLVDDFESSYGPGYGDSYRGTASPTCDTLPLPGFAPPSPLQHLQNMPHFRALRPILANSFGMVNRLSGAPRSAFGYSSPPAPTFGYGSPPAPAYSYADRGFAGANYGSDGPSLSYYGNNGKKDNNDDRKKYGTGSDNAASNSQNKDISNGVDDDKSNSDTDDSNGRGQSQGGNDSGNSGYENSNQGAAGFSEPVESTSSAPTAETDSSGGVETQAEQGYEPEPATSSVARSSHDQTKQPQILYQPIIYISPQYQAKTKGSENSGNEMESQSSASNELDSGNETPYDNEQSTESPLQAEPPEPVETTEVPPPFDGAPASPEQTAHVPPKNNGFSVARSSYVPQPASMPYYGPMLIPVYGPFYSWNPESRSQLPHPNYAGNGFNVTPFKQLSPAKSANAYDGSFQYNSGTSIDYAAAPVLTQPQPGHGLSTLPPTNSVLSDNIASPAYGCMPPSQAPPNGDTTSYVSTTDYSGAKNRVADPPVQVQLTWSDQPQRDFPELFTNYRSELEPRYEYEYSAAPAVSSPSNDRPVINAQFILY